MTFSRDYVTAEPSRAEVDAFAGTTLIEFGAPWCGHCIAAQALLEAGLGRVTPTRHLKVEDGRGRPLGRSFQVKLWPTLVLLRDGKELGRVVRPTTRDAIDQLLSRIES